MEVYSLKYKKMMKEILQKQWYRKLSNSPQIAIFVPILEFVLKFMPQ